MAAANINFQPSTSSVPSGFIADTGKAYAGQNGQTYGWNVSNTTQTRDRNTAASTEKDTLAHFGKSGAASKWEIAVPNGNYSVTITAGDATYFDSKYVIAAEGTTIVNATPTSGARWATASGVVKVADGRLTVTGVSGSFNNKINSIKIASTTAAPTTATGAGVKAPTAPTWVGAAASGSNAATVTWGDVSGETGYIIEKSTNAGSTFSEAGRVGAGVTSYKVSGLTASTTYTFRVKAFNSVGVSGASVQQTIKTAAATTSTPAPTTPAPTPGPIQIVNGHTLGGVSVNGGTASEFRGPLNDMGIKNVRLWYNVDWTATSINKWYADRAAAYKSMGFKVMMVVINERPTDYNTAKSFYTRLANDAGLRNSVDFWQIGNEPNMPQFWSGSASSYVNTSLKPAFEALKARGETVVGAGPSWDVAYAKTLQAAGYSKYCDYAAFHPYADDAANIIQRASGAKAAFGGKPIMFTEWNVTGQSGNTTRWISELNKAAAGLAKVGALSYYFGMEVSNTHVGQGGLMKTDGSRNTPFYNAMKDWLN
jgi:hypothetical protein